MAETIIEIKPMNEAELKQYVLHRRFDRFGRLVGDPAMNKLRASHAMVIGLGGVGSWAAEMLLRSGIGELTIVDFDDVCVTNTNRQLHSTIQSVGKKKAQVLGERFQTINPQAQINVIPVFYNEQTADTIFAKRPDYVFDAIDNVTAKCHLIAKCRAENIPLMVAVGSGGRIDPLQIKVNDLAFTSHDPLAKSVRRILREKHNFPTDESVAFGVKAVYSTEPPLHPFELKYDGGKGFRCVCVNKAENNLHSCDNRNLIRGTAGFVTGAFGMVAASTIVRDLMGDSYNPEEI